MPFYLQAPAAMGGGVDKANAQVAEIPRRNPVRGHLMQAAVDRFNKNEAAMGRRYIEGGLVLQETDPDVASAWWRLGQIHAHRGRKDEARAAFTTVLRLDPALDEAKKSLQAL
ncbi:MAG: hypothetical protein KatS3mg128_0727 [Silanimonas sp.]|nr:MAG: hypothetical protein KatS3mg128_0727 [Silanimonas sp.]